MATHNGETALITGASSGIGEELTRLFARDGYDLVLVARGKSQLEALAAQLRQQHGVSVTVLAKDLAQPAAAQAIYDELTRAGTTVDVLVNDAGYATYGSFTEIPAETELAMLQVNMAALTHLCKLFLPPMVRRGSGRVLNVASTAAFQPGPLMAAYYASKAYVLSLSEALANELRGTGVTVTALCPGPTRSGFQSRAKMEDSKLVQGNIMAAAPVARAGYRAMQAGKTVEIPGLRNRLLVQAGRVTPRKTLTGIVRRMQERVR
jgi:uncharacterized protein